MHIVDVKKTSFNHLVALSSPRNMIAEMKDLQYQLINIDYIKEVSIVNGITPKSVP